MQVSAEPVVGGGKLVAHQPAPSYTPRAIEHDARSSFNSFRSNPQEDAASSAHVDPGSESPRRDEFSQLSIVPDASPQLTPSKFLPPLPEVRLRMLPLAFSKSEYTQINVVLTCVDGSANGHVRMGVGFARIRLACA